MVQVAWAHGDAYDLYVGRWSRLVAAPFVAWLNLSPRSRWLDVGCGSGALTEAVLDWTDPADVVGVDPSAGFLATARQRISDGRVAFRVGDAQSLPVEERLFDAVVSGLVLNFVPDPHAALVELRRANRPGGVVAAYVWDYAEGMTMIRSFWDAAVALDPAAADLDEGRRFPLCRPEPLHTLWARVGLTDVEVRSFDVATVFADFDDYWTPFLGGQGPAPGYAASLTEDGRRALRDELRSRLPVEPDGHIRLTARAWAVRGRSPAPRGR